MGRIEVPDKFGLYLGSSSVLGASIGDNLIQTY